MKNLMHYVVSLALTSLAAMPAAAQGQDSSFTRIVGAGDPVPGGTGTFLQLSAPSLDNGVVAFSGVSIDGSNFRRAIYTGGSGPVSVLFDTDTTVPGSTEKFTFFSSPSFDSGNVAFVGSPGGAMFTNLGGPLTKVVDQSTPIPGGGETFSLLNQPMLVGQTIVFHSDFTTGSTVGGRGIFSLAGGSFTTLVDNFTPMPNASEPFNNFSQGAFDGTNVAFLGTGFTQQGVYRLAGGSIIVVADRSTPIPDGMGAFTGYGGNPAVSGGNVVFVGVGSSAQRGLYSTIGGSLNRLADRNTPVPEAGGNFWDFTSLAVDGENVAFVGTGIVDGASMRGIYAFIDGSLIKIIDTNDTLDGQPLSGPDPDYPGSISRANFVISPEGFVGDQIAFRVIFPDFTDAIYVRNRAAGSPFIFRKVADTDTQIPGEVFNFTSFAPPSLDGTKVTFWGHGINADRTALQTGIYRDSGGTLNIVVDRDTPLPTESGSFTGFGGDPSTELDNLAFLATGATATGYRGGVFADTGSGLELIVGNDRSVQVPGDGGSFTWAQQPSLDVGNIAFKGYSSSGTQGIYSKVGDTFSLIADTSTPVPGGDGSPFRYFCSPSFDAGNTAFGGYHINAAGNAQKGIYTDEGGVLRVVADSNTSLPGEGGRFTFLDFCSASIDGDQIVFAGGGFNADGLWRIGIYTEIDGALNRVADTTTPARLKRSATIAKRGFSALNRPALDNGNVAFAAYHFDDTDGRYKYGIFLKHEGEIFKVAATGDALDGKTVRAAYLWPEALTGGTVGFLVLFDDTQPSGALQQAVYVAALDRDGDAIPDDQDNCQRVANPDQADSDPANPGGDACQDSDGDGVLDVVDNCPLPNPDQLDTDGDGVGDTCDNCPVRANAGQEDAEGDGIGDICDADKDNDGVLNMADNCPTVANADQADLDLDLLGDLCDADTDGDFIFDIVDGFLDAGGAFVDESHIASADFSDQNQAGASFGMISSPGGLELQINDAADPATGFQIDAVAGSGQATLNICDLKPPQGRLRLTQGDSVVVTCGSASVEVLTDQVEILLADDESIIVSLPNAVTATVVDTGPAQFEVENGPLSPQDVQIALGEVTVTVPAAAITAVTEIGDGNFGIENVVESLQPITVEIGGQRIEFGPGDPPAVPVRIDIKPGSFDNSINLGSGGNTPVAIFSSATFDATAVDPTSVTLASAPVRLKGKGTPQFSVDDINGDGRPDMMVHVDTSAFDLSESAEAAILEGLANGVAIRGSGLIRVVP